MKAAQAEKGIHERGRDAAASFLGHVGMEVVERDWSGKGGTLDIVAIDGAEIVAVAVKTRWSGEKGEPGEVLNKDRRNAYASLMTEYLSKHTEYATYPVRFDVVGITALSEDRAVLRHHRAAYTVE